MILKQNNNNSPLHNFIKYTQNRLLSSLIITHFQNKAKCTTFLVKIKNFNLVKGCALNLILKQRPRGTRKWPIEIVADNNMLSDSVYFKLNLHVEG